MSTILTDNWSYVHVPKTAGHWMAAVLEHAYKTNSIPFFRYDNHIPRWMISTFFNKPITAVATIRNPYDWYVSVYEYGHWRKNQRTERIPADLEFQDWLPLAIRGKDTSMLLFDEMPPEKGPVWYPWDLGIYTVHLYTFLSETDPRNKIVPNESSWLLDSIHGCDVIRFEHLVSDSRRWLEGKGVTIPDDAFGIEPQNVTAARNRNDWKDYYTPKLLDLVARMDRPTFEAFGYET